MAADPGRAVRAIVILGVVAFGFLWLSSLGIKQSFKADETERVNIDRPRSEFKSARAFADLSKIVTYGPRPAGSKALGEAADYLSQQMRTAGLVLSDTRKQSPEYPVPHLIARCTGSQPGEIVLVTRLDTISESPGANSAASGAAVLMELARSVGRSRGGHGFTFVWLLSGNAAASPDNPGGLSTLLEELDDRLVFVVESVGDCYLELGSDRDAPLWLRGLMSDTAERQGYARHFPENGVPLKDVYGLRPTQETTVYLADPIQGGSIAQHALLHGTAQDTLEHVCVNSLQAVGDVLYHALGACDSLLTRRP